MMTITLEQQAGESDKAFAAFTLYLNLGPERSLRKVAQRSGRSYTIVQRWSHTFQWSQRVRAHVAQQQQLERETAGAILQTKLTDWAQRQVEQREAEWHWRTELLQVAQEIVAGWRAKPERFESIASLAKILELASKLGRLSSGLATDKTELTGEDGGPIRLEFQAALKKIYGQPLPGEVIEVQSEEGKLQNAEPGQPTCLPNSLPSQSQSHSAFNTPNSALGQLPAPHSPEPVPEAPSTIAPCFSIGSPAPSVSPVPKERPNCPVSGDTHD